MKKCPKCKIEFGNDFDFCNICGQRLEIQSNKLNQLVSNKRHIIIAVVVVFLVVAVGIGITLSDQKKIKDTQQGIEDYKYQKEAAEYKSTPTITDLKVNSNWTKEKRSTYIYINGSVTNTSSTKTISYFEVQAKFYDSKGNVIDSDWTNDSSDLGPGETRKFEIMHKYDSNVYDIKLSVKDVN